MKGNNIIGIPVFITCLAGYILCGCSSIEQTIQYNICNNKVEIEEIYFNNAPELKCGEQNPYREQLLSQIEFVSQKETIDPTEFEFDPEITLVASKGTTFELADSVTHYSYPAVEGIEYENKDEESYYIRILHNGEIDATYHYERDEDVIKLRQLMQDAMEYEYQSGIVTGEKGVVTFIYEDATSKICGVESAEYGYQRIAVDDLDGVIVGDTVEYTIFKEAKDAVAHAEYEGEIHNLTKNDVAATSEEYLTTLSVEYNILSFAINPDKNTFRTDRFELELSKEDFEFILSLWSDRMPASTIQELKDKYNEKFFENHILLYCGLDVADVEATTAVQPKWTGGRNYVCVKKNTEDTIPEGECRMLWVEIPIDGWNEQSFELYLY